MIKLTAESNTKIIKRFITTLVFPRAIPARSKEELNNVSIKIPALNGTMNKLTSLIEINYFVRLLFDIMGPSVEQELTIPIVIGTIPLRKIDTEPEACSFEASTISGAFSIKDEHLVGEVIETNLNTFKIMFPIYNQQIQST